jgi:replicative DNA helicase
MAFQKYVPPQNIEAEQSVLGAMLRNEKVIVEVQGILQPKDFYREAHRHVYEAMLKLAEEGEAVDLVTITMQLDKDGELEKIGGVPFIVTILNSATAVTVANVAYYARIVKEKAKIRRLIDVMTDIASSVYEDTQNIEGIMNVAEQKILAVAGAQASDGPESLNSIMSTCTYIYNLCESNSDITGLPMGFNDLDRLTGGLHPSDLILVAARPAMGKTSFALNIASHVGLHGGKVAFFSLEMSKELLMQRLLCSVGKIDYRILRTAQPNRDDWLNLVDKLNRTPIYIDDTTGIAVMDLRSKVRRLKAEHGLDLIVVDYLQLMQGRPSKNGDNRQQEIPEILHSLKALARELNVPIIVLSQLPRSVEMRQVKRPMLSDLHEFGFLEQDADIVMFLYREDYYDKDTDTPNQMDVIVAKHRNGPADTVHLYFQKEYTRFYDMIQE